MSANGYRTGALSEIAAAKHYLDTGCEVYFPLIRNGPVDFVVEKGDRLWRTQVKTATWIKSGTFSYLQARMRSANKKVTPQSGAYDLVVVVHGEELWEIPAIAIFSTNICLRGTNPSRGEEAWDAYKVR